MLKKYTYSLFLLLTTSLFITCTKEQIVPVITEFDIEVVNSDYSIPVQIIIFNKTKEADTYQWTFEGGIPSTSTNRNPGAILYEKKGEYSIKLYATNKDDSEDEKIISFKIDDPVLIGFDVEVIESNFPPVEVNITNNTTGATSYNWEFEGGLPPTSTEQYPQNIIFSEPGEHKIWLEVNNGLETYDIEKTITVEENLNPDFDWIVNFDDDDYQVPVKVTMQNNSISATSYQWTFENGLPATSTEENPEVIFNVIGNHQITLNVSNGKDSKFISKNIDVLTNTNLKTFENVKLGINSSHNNNVVGSFFSTFTRKSYTKNEVNNDNGVLIDLVYFGLNESFTLNKFVSPNDLNTTTFSTIPNATHTKFINSLELCNCSTSLTVSDFDTMVDDTGLKNLVIEETAGGLLQFDSSILPRIVLFENSTGRKGAIKIKEYVQNGQDSYMLIDIKIQKQ